MKNTLIVIAIVISVIFVGGFVYVTFFSGGGASPTTGSNTGSNGSANTSVDSTGNTTTGGSTSNSTQTSGNTGSQTTTQGTPSGSTSSGTATGPTITIAGAVGSVIVKDFKHDPQTGKYASSGYYYLGYHTPDAGVHDPSATTNPPYLISYVDANQFFTIELLQEPIAQTRIDAEQYLLTHLGVSQSDLCRLNYMVSVPYSVNQFYAGQNLGFSFCSGSVTL